mmetsp:Transcript_25401/g.45866  ORF Transcript_25401/g.45866 Transcript_25401/m.45866 type:complete len:231 (-) Transcript_25401:489-1181(-)
MTTPNCSSASAKSSPKLSNIAFCVSISSCIVSAMYPTRVTAMSRSSRVSSCCCIISSVSDRAGSEDDAAAAVEEALFPSSKSDWMLVYSCRFVPLDPPPPPVIAVFLFPLLRSVNARSSLKNFCFISSDCISPFAPNILLLESSTNPLRSIISASLICGNFSRCRSTTRTVVSRSESVDSACLMCRFSCFLVSLTWWVFAAVSVVRTTVRYRFSSESTDVSFWTRSPRNM